MEETPEGADGGRRARGREAEALAAAFLEERGYQVLARNHALRRGEVDLVAEQGGVLCFVEVRSRTGDAHGGPEETVDRRKARRVVLAATDWLEKHPSPGRDLRFDVVGVTFDPPAPPRIVHFPGAFDADGNPGLFWRRRFLDLDLDVVLDVDFDFDLDLDLDFDLDQNRVVRVEDQDQDQVEIGMRVPATLYVVATPIGNLGDLSPRAAEVLRTVRAVAAEDTRRTLKLFAHLGVPAPQLLSLPAFDERGRLAPVLDRLRAGEDVALCTDAGTPGVSDPGAALVAAAWEAGARVVPIPGPSAAVAALAASGFPADRFLFTGFLPRKGGARADALRALAAAGATVVLYEAGNRTRATLRDLAEALGDRDALVARELTKLHEELARGSLTALAERFSGEVLGEVTIVVSGAGAVPAAAEPAEPLEDELRRRLAAGEPPSGIAREVARARGLRRHDVYAELERLKKK